jgi:hypothetical protein
MGGLDPDPCPLASMAGKSVKVASATSNGFFIQSLLISNSSKLFFFRMEGPPHLETVLILSCQSYVFEQNGKHFVSEMSAFAHFYLM